MSAIDTVKAFMTTLEANGRKSAANYLSNDFAFIGWTPRPLNKDDFLTVMGGLKAGIPSLTFKKSCYISWELTARLYNNRV